MADTKISGLPASTTPLAGTEELPIVQSGVTKKVSVGDLTSGRAVATAGGSFTDNFVQGTAAKGVNFTANTPAAGMTSQLLNWYEEGTWAPAFSASGLSGVTPGSNTFGRYTRVGRLVTVVFYIYTTDTFTKGSNPLSITGLPFTSANITGGYATVSLWNATRFDATPPVVGAIPNNSTSIALYSSFNATGSGADPVAVSSANMRSAAGENCNFVGGTATYMV